MYKGRLRRPGWFHGVRFCHHFYKPWSKWWQIRVHHKSTRASPFFSCTLTNTGRPGYKGQPPTTSKKFWTKVQNAALPLYYVQCTGILTASNVYKIMYSHSILLRSSQLHGNVKEDLEQLRLEEASLKRRQKLQDGQISLGVANGGRLSVDGGSGQPSLSQLQRKREELG